MSHDRGCPCGLDRGEYDTCNKPDCDRRSTQLAQVLERATTAKSLKDLSLYCDELDKDLHAYKRAFSALAIAYRIDSQRSIKNFNVEQFELLIDLIKTQAGVPLT